MNNPTMVDVLVIGGGSAGMAAALSAEKLGAKEVLLVERDRELGGILNQCIHSGFGLHHFKEELTGPEYAHRFIQKVRQSTIQVLLDTTVLSIEPNSSSPFAIEATMINQHGCQKILAKSAVLAMGCRERTAGAINLQGSRPAGVLTAGSAQRLINMEGQKVGQKAVIYGSGDIGLIMARRLSLEGCPVQSVLEIMPRCGGLRRNVEQCLLDFEIPLLLDHKITKVHGKNRLTGISAAPLDETGQILTEKEFFIPCDTLLLSVGLIPENELSARAGAEICPPTKGPVVNSHFETSIPGLFACGNVLHVHDIVDFVTEEGTEAGAHAAQYARGHYSKETNTPYAALHTADPISYILPQTLIGKEEAPSLRLRVKSPIHDFSLVLEESSTEKILLQRKIAFAEPSQMIHWKIPPQIWTTIRPEENCQWQIKIIKE